MSYRAKIYQDVNVLTKQVAEWQAQGERVVFTNGVFDLVHIGHVSYLEASKALGARLVVGINTDKSVSTLKGPSRPINDEQSRIAVIAALQSVDAVILFGEQTPLVLIQALRPDVLVKGADYDLSHIVGAAEVIAAGGEVQQIDFIEGYSSSAMIEKIRKDG